MAKFFWFVFVSTQSVIPRVRWQASVGGDAVEINK